MPSPTTATYEEQWPLGIRQGIRLFRWLRWHAKGCLGRDRHFLVELRWRLGDEVMALPVFAALQQQYPRLTIHVMTHYPDLFTDYPGVQVVDTPPPSVDRYVLLRGAPRTRHRLAVYAEKLHVPLPETRPTLHYQQWAWPDHLARPEGEGPLVAIAPGASWPSKRWLADRWVAVIHALEDQGCRVVVLGAEGEGIGAGTDCCGQSSVRDAAAVLHHAALLIACDSGLMHLGLAAGTPVIALFGPTDPSILIRDDERFTALCSRESCHGFWNHAAEVGEPGVCPEGHACCLTSITVDEVMDAARARLEALPS